MKSSLFAFFIMFATTSYAGVRYHQEASGLGYSSSFTESSCLFCFDYKSEAQDDASAQAVQALQELCRQDEAFLIDEPDFKNEDCIKIKGWTSYYKCISTAVGTCETRK